MTLAALFVSMRLFVRLLLGVLLLSVGVSKLVHRRQFEQGIQEYKIFPQLLKAKSIQSLALATAIAVAELLAGLGITNPLDALAASKKAAVPNCYQCPCNGCQEVVCYFSVSCSSHGNCAREIVTYQGGCVGSPSQCPSTIEQAGCCSPGSC